MADAEIDIDGDELFRQVMAQPGVRAAVQERAAKIAAMTRRELARGRVDASVSIKPVGLSSGRAAVNVEVSAAEDQRGRAAGALRRAVRGVRR